jgi:hypothetical protein
VVPTPPSSYHRGYPNWWAPPPPTGEEGDDDDDEDIAEGIPPVDASTVANAEKVGASGADQSRVVVTGGEQWVGGGWVVVSRHPLSRHHLSAREGKANREDEEAADTQPDMNLRVCWFPT